VNILQLEYPLYYKELIALGHRVISCGTDPGCDIWIDPVVYSYETIRSRLPADFIPDVILVCESLMKRRFPDLTDSKLPLVFYSIDGHMHFDWHVRYGRQFDLIISSQQDIAEKFKQLGNDAHWLPWSYTAGIKPFYGERRPIDIGIVGSFMGMSRPRRMNMLMDLSKRFRVKIFGPPFTNWLSQAETQAVYRMSKVVLNETICGELNFRVFESIAEGACLVCENEDNGLDQLFEPGIDYLPTNRQDLASGISGILGDEKYRHSMSLAGWNKLAIQHQPINRAGKLVVYLQKLCDQKLNLSAQTQNRTQLKLEKAFCWRRCDSNLLCFQAEAEIKTEKLYRQLNPQEVAHYGSSDPELLIEYAGWLREKGKVSQSESLLRFSNNEISPIALESRLLLDRLAGKDIHSVRPVLSRLLAITEKLVSLDRVSGSGMDKGNRKPVPYPCWGMQVIQEALSIFPEHPSFQLCMAVLQMKMNLSDAALFTIATLLDSLDDSQLQLRNSALYLRAGLLDRIGNRRDAVLLLLDYNPEIEFEACSEIHEIQRFIPYINNMLPDSDLLEYTSKKRQQLVSRTFTEWHDAAKTNPLSLDSILFIREAIDKSRPAEAIFHSKMCVRLEPNNPEALELLARLLKACGRDGEARMNFRRAELSREKLLLLRNKMMGDVSQKSDTMSLLKLDTPLI
jgi:hypothetical protein